MRAHSSSSTRYSSPFDHAARAHLEHAWMAVVYGIHAICRRRLGLPQELRPLRDSRGARGPASSVPLTNSSNSQHTAFSCCCIRAVRKPRCQRRRDYVPARRHRSGGGGVAPRSKRCGFIVTTSLRYCKLSISCRRSNAGGTSCSRSSSAVAFDHPNSQQTVLDCVIRGTGFRDDLGHRIREGPSSLGAAIQPRSQP